MDSSNLSHPSSTVSAITGTWRIPYPNTACNIQSPGVFNASEWIGISDSPLSQKSDGSLIQMGTEQQLIDGKFTYNTWYELLPDPPIAINLATRPGDVISATIRLVDPSAKMWEMDIRNITTGESAKPLRIRYDTKRASAEWIYESSTNTIDQYSIHIIPIGYDRINFIYDGPTAGNFATINGVTGSISAFARARLDMAIFSDNILGSGPVSMSKNGIYSQDLDVLRIGIPIFVPSNLNKTGASFSINRANCEL